MTHQICDACECVSHCRKNGCVPLTPMDQAPKFAIPPSSDVATLQRELSIAFDAVVRERMKVKEQELALDAARDFLQAQNDLDNRELQGINGEDWSVLRRRCNQARNDLDEALSKVPQ